MNLRAFFITLGLMATGVAWSHWSTLAEAADRWRTDIQYSHGWLIPVFSVFLLYHRREMLLGQKLEPSWLFVPFVIGALLLRGLEVRYSFHGFDPLSMVPMAM